MDATGKLPEHHVPEFGAVLHRGVPILRARDWSLLAPDQRYRVDVLAAGAPDLRSRLVRKTEFAKCVFERQRSFDARALNTGSVFDCTDTARTRR